MLMRFPLSTVITAGLILFSSLTARAEGPLDLIPADASVIVRVKSPQATIAKVANFVNAVQPGMGFAVQMQAPALGVGISNPTMGGVDLKNDWYVAVFAVKNAEPGVVFLVPASKGTEERSGVVQMKEAVGDQFSFASKDNWVAYSMDEAVIELVEDCIDGAADSVAIDRRSGDLFAAGDASVYVNLSGIATTYDEELKAAEEQLDVLLEGLGAQLPPTPGINMGPILEMYGSLAHGALRAARDADAFTLGLTISNESIAIEELLLVKDGSGSDKFLQSHKTSDLNILHSLPQNKLGYFAIKGDFGGLAAWGLDFAAQMFGDGEDNKETLEKLTKAAADLKTVKFGAAAWAFGLADRETGILQGYALTEATPASKMREITRSMGAGYNFNVPGVKQEISIEQDAEKYGDLTADVIRMKQEFEEAADPLGIQKKLQEALYGESGMEQRVVVRNENQMVQTFGGGQAEMTELLEALDNPATGDTALKQSRAKLLEQANLIGLIDLPNLALKIANVALRNEDVKALGNIPVKAEHLDGAKVPASFIGFSAGTEPQGVRIRTAIPAKMFQNFVQIGAYVQQQQLKERQKNNDN